MEAIAVYLLTAATLMWCGVLLLPWRPWSREPALDAAPCLAERPLDDVTVLIPARNEAVFIHKTLGSVASQGSGLRIILVDDQSTDGTAQRARSTPVENLIVLAGEPPPAGWSGKLWALEQGRGHIHTRFTLLLDADIELQPGIVQALYAKMEQEGFPFVSLMAAPRLVGFWERLLMPAFVYFFKLLYPFRLAGSQRSRVAAPP